MVVQRTLTPPVGVRSSHPQPVYRSSNMLRVFYRGVAQMVARLVRDQEAWSSNLHTPTTPPQAAACGGFFIHCMKKGKSGPKRLFAVPAEMPTFMQVYHGNMCNWAQQQPAVAHVLAQTEQGNLASERVLQKCGFRKCAAGPVVWWILSW